jgi:SAM-dependent methyltransferase
LPSSVPKASVPKASVPKASVPKASVPKAKPSAAIDHELRVGAQAHYDDAAYYTQTYAQRIEDVAYYVDTVTSSKASLGKRSLPHVLEMGAGNGRITLPLARHGVSVTAVDWSQAMLSDLRARLLRESKEVQKRVTIVHGDMRTVRLPKTFDWVLCPFNTALHLYTRPDAEAFFEGVRSHLLPNGFFVADLSVPLPLDLARDPKKAHRVPNFRYPGEGSVKYQEFFDYDRARQVLFISMEFEPVRDKKRAFMTPVAHRQYHPLEWEALLHYNGFDVSKLHGDFQAGPFTRDSDVFITHARAHKARIRA